MPNLYANLSQLRARFSGVESFSDDPLLLVKLEEASRSLDAACHRHFFAEIVTRKYKYLEKNELLINDGFDLLSVDTLTTDNDTTTIVAADYFLMCGDSDNIQPYNRIEINSGGSASFGYSTTPQQANKIIGVWGYHNRYASAWALSGATVNETFTDSDTTLTVSGATKFESGQTIQIESEWLYISYRGNDLTVERGVNGSTAASHASGTAISIYRPMVDVREVTLEYAAFLYRRGEAHPVTFESSFTADGGTEIPPLAPSSIHRFVKRYRRAI